MFVKKKKRDRNITRHQFVIRGLCAPYLLILFSFIQFYNCLTINATSNALSVMEDKCKCVLDDVADVNGTSVVNIETGPELCLTPT